MTLGLKRLTDAIPSHVCSVADKSREGFLQHSVANTKVTSLKLVKRLVY